MTQEDQDKIRKIAEGHTTIPSADAWQRINAKMKTRDDRRRLVSYRNMSVAAMMIAVLSVTVIFTHYLKEHNPSVFASNEHFVPLIIEELDTDGNDTFYSIENISRLKNAYEKAGF